MNRDAQTTEQRRRADLAKIHIAKKDLGLDDDIYRQVIREVGKSRTGSAADLDIAGRSRVLAHFKRSGWKPARRKNTRATGMASDDQVALIRHIWARMVLAGVVRNQDPSAVRTWLMNNTKRFHPEHVGYSDPRFLPADVAEKVIEQLKKWADRCEVEWR